MTKNEITAHIASQAGVTKTAAGAMLAALTDLIHVELRGGRDISIPDVGALRCQPGDEAALPFPGPEGREVQGVEGARRRGGVMPRRDLHIHACEHGGFAVFGTGDRPLAAFNTLGEALGFIQKEMAPEKPKGSEQSPRWDLPGPEPR